MLESLREEPLASMDCKALVPVSYSILDLIGE